MKRRARSKFGNVVTYVDGVKCGSKKEARRLQQLQLMEKAGAIRALRTQTPWILIPKQAGERDCKYLADFEYDERTDDGWHHVVEDSKGRRTRDYIIKRKLMLFVHGIKIRET